MSDRYWVCEDCGWTFGTETPKPEHECDNCGGHPMCSECGDLIDGNCKCGESAT